MFSVLSQSHVSGSRRLGIAAAASAAVHGVLILAAVSYTVPFVVEHERTNPPGLRYIRPPQPRPPMPTTAPPALPGAPEPPRPGDPAFTFRGLDIPPTVLLSSPTMSTQPVVWPGARLSTAAGGNAEPGGNAGGADAGAAVDVAAVDRAPHLIGRPPVPEYPAALRRSGERGRVLLQFVIDTAGRAEMESVVAREATHDAFVEAVRAVLPRYRFSPGEAAGRRVRTLVAMPFEFTLER